MALQLRAAGPGATDANGTQAFAYMPSLDYGWTNVGSTTGVFTWPSSWNIYSQAGNAATYGSQYRINSFGICVRSIQAVNTTSGYLVLTECNGVKPGGTLPVGQLQGTNVFTCPLSPGLEVCWFSNPQGPQAHVWQAWNTSTTFLYTFEGWSSLVIQLAGAAASSPSVIQIEYVMNIEILVDQDNVISQLVPKPPPAMPLVTTTVSAVRNKIESFIEGGAKKVEDRISQMVREKLASSGLNQLTASMASLGV